MEDQDYMHELKCRYSELRSGSMGVEHIAQMIDSLRDLLATPQQRHFQRWPILGRYIVPNINTGQTWEDEINYVENWMYERIAYLDNMWYEPDCALNSTGPETKAAKVMLYPNPASEYLHVESTIQGSEVRVYNEIGQVVYKKNETALKYDIDVREWSAGVYVVEVKSNAGMVREKVSVW